MTIEISLVDSRQVRKRVLKSREKGGVMKEVGINSHQKMLQIAERLDFFRIFTEDELGKIINKKSQIYLYDKGETIIEEGDSDSSLFVILSGIVVVYKTLPQDPIALLGPGEFIGETAFVTQYKRTASVSAQEQTLAMCVTHGTMNQYPIEIREKFQRKFIEIIAVRLNQMNNAYATRWQ